LQFKEANKTFPASEGDFILWTWMQLYCASSGKWHSVYIFYIFYFIFYSPIVSLIIVDQQRRKDVALAMAEGRDPPEAKKNAKRKTAVQIAETSPRVSIYYLFILTFSLFGIFIACILFITYS
jgi:hypothetical protein